MDTVIEVTNLSTGATVVYFGIAAKQAVICAYAQSLKDWNTWDYAKYTPMIQEGSYTFSIGDFFAFKD